MEPEYHAAFFKAAGKLPALVDAQFLHASMPVTVLAEFVKEARTVENLAFGCLDIEGSEEDFETVTKALENHPTLKTFSLSDFSLNDDTVIIDGLIESLATIPNLQTVKLEVTHSRRRSVVGSVAAAKKVKVSLSGNALAVLCGSPTLASLYLNRLNLDLDDYEALAKSIENSNLKHLAIPHCNLTDESADHLAIAIGRNESLETLDLTCNNITDEGCVVIATALKDNTSLKLLRLWGNVKMSEAGLDTVCDMLDHHCSLERVPLMRPQTHNIAKADAFTPKSAANHAA